LRSCGQSRAQEPPEREALDRESEPLDEQNRSNSELDHGDGSARRKEQMDVENDERERGKPTEPGHVRGPDQWTALDRRGRRRIESTILTDALTRETVLERLGVTEETLDEADASLAGSPAS
jgi:hypothetical protein